MKRATLYFFSILLLINSSFGQNARSMRYTVPLAGTVNLANINDPYDVNIISKEMPEPEAGADQEKLRQLKEIIKKKYPHKLSAANSASFRTTATSQPTVVLAIQTDSFSGIPPDNCAAVSKENRMVAVMNDMFTIYAPVGDTFIRQTSLENFSRASGLTGPTNYRFDPKIVYDPNADRFISIILNSTNQYNYIVLGFSQTNDPNGTWAFYKFYGDFNHDTTWFDYPAIAITENEVFFTGNQVKYDSSWQAGFKESVIYQVRKSDGYSGLPSVTYKIYDSIAYDGYYLRCLYPLNPADTVLGPSQYLLSNRDFDTLNDTIFVVKVPDTIGSLDSNITVTALASSLSYGMPPDARQPDTTVELATNDNRILGGFIKDNEIQFVSESVNPLNGNSAIYHGIISNFTTSPVVTANIYSVDSLDFGYPNISFTAHSVTGFNQAIISLEYSGPTTCPSFGAIFYDGAAYSGITVIHHGAGSINVLSGKVQRWGDYSGSQPNWNATGTVYVEGLYGKANKNYANYFAELAPPANAGTPKLSTSAALKSVVYPNPSREIVRYEFTITKQQAYNFVIIDMQGRQVALLTNKVCEAGDNTIQFNIAKLEPGFYKLQAQGEDGTTIDVQTFVRN